MIIRNKFIKILTTAINYYINQMDKNINVFCRLRTLFDNIVRLFFPLYTPLR